MKITNYAHEKSIINHYLQQLRDVDKQKNRQGFRDNIRRISTCMAYEISKELTYKEIQVQSPLGKTKGERLEEQPVIALVLRAGLAMHQGFLDVFQEADHCFISAYREEGSIDNLKVHVEYLASPNLEGRTVLLIDPMLATGKSLVLGYEALLRRGTPEKLIVASIVSAPTGIKTIEAQIPDIQHFYTASIDEGLNEQAYVVPGLGDAGDLAYGSKESS